MLTYRFVLTFVIALIVCASSVFARRWTDSTGKYGVEAEFVALDEGNVRLLRSDGKMISVPIEILSEADRRYVDSMEQPVPTQVARAGTE